MRSFLIIGAMAAALAGCQTPQESLASAQDVCAGSGFRPGTRSFANCVNGNYRENRRVSQETSNAVATGVVAGVVGGAIIGAASRPYYGGGYYNRGYYNRGYYGGPGYYYY